MEKNYKYQFSKVFYIVAIVGSLLALGCIAINVIRLIGFLSKNVAPGFYEWVSIIISVLLSIAFIPIIIGYSFFFHSRIASQFEKADVEEAKLSAIAQENLTGVRVVRAFGKEIYERKRLYQFSH